MTQRDLEDRIHDCGRQFFTTIGDERPSLFNKSAWTGKLMDACMRNERFKVQLFRFIDVLPYLTTMDSFSRHLDEYFGSEESLPAVLKWGLRGLGWGGTLAKSAASAATRKNLEMMARDFIVGATASETVARLHTLREQGFAFTVDVLGEATVSEREADEYLAGYRGLLDALGKAQRGWPALGGGSDNLDWGHAPRINVSLKPSALFSLADPADVEGSVHGMLVRLVPLYRAVVALGGFLCLDTEMRRFKNITFELYRRLRTDPEFRAYPHLGLAVQAYLRESEQDADELLEWARRETLPISIGWSRAPIGTMRRCWLGRAGGRFPCIRSRPRRMRPTSGLPRKSSGITTRVTSPAPRTVSAPCRPWRSWRTPWTCRRTATSFRRSTAWQSRSARRC